MSASIVMRPTKTDGTYLSDDLKFALQNVCADYHKGITFDSSHMLLLIGMKASGIKDADKVIEAIEKYGSVTIQWEY